MPAVWTLPGLQGDSGRVASGAWGARKAQEGRACLELFPGLNRDFGGRGLSVLKGGVDQRQAPSDPSRQLSTPWASDWLWSRV